ncbi:MAG: rhomboid family intramembrane serine protease [Candidatus Zixiibacteriota bacterium]|nr:MAG: rhomboid family intramembrane serine protease [candidate division Zixibacteria bacterium]
MSYFQERDPGPRGRLRIGPGRVSPFIKVALIVNSAVFVLQFLVGDRFTILLGLYPDLFFSEFPNYIYQIFTYMFLHGGLFHIAFNMFILWMFGTEIEYAWGTRSFAWFYLMAGVAGGVLSLIAHSVLPSGLIIGASGAIYGVMIAYWLMFPNRLLYLYFLIPVKVKWAVPGFMLIGFLFGGSGIAHMAHLGGALYGLLYLKLDWRWLTLGKKIRNLRYKQQSAKLEKRRRQAEDTMKRVDAILDKINEVGIENISDSDRKFLEEASSELSKEEDAHKQ